MSISASRPAPALTQTIPLLRPQLPSFEKLVPYLRSIDERRHYTNFGPLVTLLEERLAEFFRLSRRNLVVVANGTTALSAALQGLGARPGSKCLLPAWTFVASASAVCAANLVPHFVDVTRETWMPDPNELLRRGDLDEVGAVMIVAPFGRPHSTAAWDAFSETTGIPVLIDAAAGFDTVAVVPEARPLRPPVMISLHATKVLGTGEGGLLISTNEMTIHRARQVCNFGIWGSPEGQIVGYNGKLSEYHAAIGLASLEEWPQRRADLASRTARYAEELTRLPSVEPIPGFGNGWVSSYCTVRVPAHVHTIVDHLAYMGVESRRWWQDGVHAQAAYRRFPHDELTVTAELAASALNLPFSHDMTDDQIVRVVDCLASALRAPG